MDTRRFRACCCNACGFCFFACFKSSTARQSAIENGDIFIERNYVASAARRRQPWTNAVYAARAAAFDSTNLVYDIPPKLGRRVACKRSAVDVDAS